MPDYRYQTQYPDGHAVRGVMPSKSNNPRYFAHHYYTSEQEDSKELYVNTIGHQKSWPTRNCVSRKKPCAIFHYVISGHGFFNGIEVSANHFFFTLPYQEHSIIQDPYDPLEFYWISFSGFPKNELLKECNFRGDMPIYTFDFSNLIVSRFDEIIYEAHDEVDTELWLKGLLYELLARHKAMNRETIDNQPKKQDYIYYKKALQYIFNHCGERISTSHIAKHLSICTV